MIFGDLVFKHAEFFMDTTKKLSKALRVNPVTKEAYEIFSKFESYAKFIDFYV